MQIPRSRAARVAPNLSFPWRGSPEWEDLRPSGLRIRRYRPSDVCRRIGGVGGRQRVPEGLQFEAVVLAMAVKSFASGASRIKRGVANSIRVHTGQVRS